MEIYEQNDDKDENDDHGDPEADPALPASTSRALDGRHRVNIPANSMSVEPLPYL